MSHQYTDKSELKTWLGITGSGQDTNIDFALDAAAAAIDNYCGRQFTISDVETRLFDCEFMDYAEIDDIATTTGLVVKTLNADGTVNETLTIDTDFYEVSNDCMEDSPYLTQTAKTVMRSISYVSSESASASGRT